MERTFDSRRVIGAVLEIEERLGDPRFLTGMPRGCRRGARGREARRADPV